MNYRNSRIIMTLIFAVLLNACSNLSVVSTSNFEPSRTTKQMDVITKSLSNTPLPSNTLPSVPSETPIMATATDDISDIMLSEISSVNIDGFACAAAMGINLLYSDDANFDRVLCDDISVYMYSSVQEQAFNTISDFFVYNVGSFLQDNEIPVSVVLDTEINYDDFPALLQAEKLPIAIIKVNGMWHAIVIVGYDPGGGGLQYLDSLHNMGNEIPNEKIFLEDYGVNFLDAWVATFILKYSD